MDVPTARRVAVIGGGIAGLAAAWFVRQQFGSAAVDVTVYEGASRLGGKLVVGDVGGVAVDLGAEAMLARRPEAIDLASAVGLADDIVHPATTTASIWSRGELHPMPTGHLMGVPGDLRTLAASGLLSATGLARVRFDRVLPRSPQDGDVAIGKYVASRLGREVVDRLVEPLLGGVYAGHADELSLRATVPQLSQLASAGGSLTAGVRELLDRTTATRDPETPAPPVFAGIRGGVGRLPLAVAQASGARIRTDAMVRELRRTPEGWQLTIGATRDPRVEHADAVIIAVPATPASRLLADITPAAAADLSGIEYASVALVTFVFPEAAFAGRLHGSGFLVPPVEGRAIKAATFSSAKWRWLADTAPGTVVLRASLGRHHEEADLQRDDADLVAVAAADLAEATGVAATPIGTRVKRWGGGLPQYAVGHVDRVARIRAAVADVPGLAMCGAAYDGLGIPAVIASAKQAAEQVGAVLRPGVGAARGGARIGT
jgi:oxygen-dependent protoporphyrinogen oxidase